MRYVIATLAAAGIALSSFALATHYGPRVDPTELLRSDWNSAYVSQSPYSVIYGVPVALVGIVGYALLGILALLRRVVLTVYVAGAGLIYTLYLTDIEAHFLGVWCAYCVSSLVVMTLIAILAFAAFLYQSTPSTIQ
jgi:vitamin-K-epoxide reductase (warfarin-sensitive)